MPPPHKKLNLCLAEMQFPAVLRGLLALFSLFLVDILSRSMQIWTNYETHILKQWGITPLSPIDPRAPPVVNDVYWSSRQSWTAPVN